MSIGEFFAEQRVESQERRKRYRSYGSSRLEALGVQFTTRNDGAHLIITHAGKVVDYWPGTGKFIVRGSNRHRRGINNLLKTLGVDISSV